MNDLLTEPKNQSGGGLKGGTDKFCHSYQAGDAVQKLQQGIVFAYIAFASLFSVVPRKSPISVARLFNN